MDDVFKNKFTYSEWVDGGRKSTLDLILSEEYGIRSPKSDRKLEYRVEETAIIDNIVVQKVMMRFDDLDMRFYLYSPNDSEKHDAFIFVFHEYAEDLADKDLVRNFDSNKYCPVRVICARGFAVAVMPTRDIARDTYDFKIRDKRNIFATINEARHEHDWGTLQAWSWGTSKVLDYLEQQENINKERVCVIGHSRGGKTALIASAQDERFFLAVSCCSGNSGAAISRNNTGETILNITNLASYWFAPNYLKYRGKEDELPFDQHQLLGLIAPRHLYVLSAEEDAWACPENELLSCRLASQYYELYGERGLVAPDEIKLDTPYAEGNIAYLLKRGKHAINPSDWGHVMDYFEKI